MKHKGVHIHTNHHVFAMEHQVFGMLCVFLCGQVSHHHSGAAGHAGDLCDVAALTGSPDLIGQLPLRSRRPEKHRREKRTREPGGPGGGPKLREVTHFLSWEINCEPQESCQDMNPRSIMKVHHAIFAFPAHIASTPHLRDMAVEVLFSNSLLACWLNYRSWSPRPFPG